MSAEILRRAASLMREVANKAAAQPETAVHAEGVWLNSRFYCIADPSYQLAVANLLDNEASLIEGVADFPHLHMPLNDARVVLLTAIANAYLGDDA